MTECVECRAYIEPKAIKCADCGSYQDWRRHLELGGSLLSILSAVISTLAAALTVYLTFFYAPAGDIDILRVVERPSSLRVSIFNTGSSPVYVLFSDLFIDLTVDGKIYKFSLSFLPSDDKLVITGKSLAVVVMNLRERSGIYEIDAGNQNETGTKLDWLDIPEEELKTVLFPDPKTFRQEHSVCKLITAFVTPGFHPPWGLKFSSSSGNETEIGCGNVVSLVVTYYREMRSVWRAK